jgi:hypothetical protein
MPTFPLKLQETYWKKGFFNVTVRHQGFVTMTEGPIEIYLGESAQPIAGRVSRSANQNATPRVFGNKPLAAFFQANYRVGDEVPIDILSPTAVRVRGKAGS